MVGRSAEVEAAVDSRGCPGSVVRFFGTMKSEEYVSQQEGAYRVAGTRVSLDSIVYAFQEGQTPETTRR